MTYLKKLFGPWGLALIGFVIVVIGLLLDDGRVREILISVGGLSMSIAWYWTFIPKDDKPDESGR